MKKPSSKALNEGCHTKKRKDRSKLATPYLTKKFLVDSVVYGHIKSDFRMVLESPHGSRESAWF